MRKLAVSILACSFLISGCDAIRERAKPKSTSGVKKATAHVKVGGDGNTNEQRNVLKRLEKDNQPGSIKHLYVISAMSGQTIIYSTVKGKVTSSGKRLTPSSVAASDGQYVGSSFNGVPINIGDRSLRTTEVLQDDGTYGSSVPYLYWTDTKGIYHQHYVSGGQILHVSSEPLSVGRVMINMEMSKAPGSEAEAEVEDSVPAKVESVKK